MAPLKLLGCKFSAPNEIVYCATASVIQTFLVICAAPVVNPLALTKLIWVNWVGVISTVKLLSTIGATWLCKWIKAFETVNKLVLTELNLLSLIVVVNPVPPTKTPVEGVATEVNLKAQFFTVAVLPTAFEAWSTLTLD